MEIGMTDSEILRSVGLGTLLDNVDNNLIGRWMLKAMAQARTAERNACATWYENGGLDEANVADAMRKRANV
jgi:hypothetical protein